MVGAIADADDADDVAGVAAADDGVWAPDLPASRGNLRTCTAEGRKCRKGLHGEHNHFSGMVKYADCYQQQGTEVTMTSRPLSALLSTQVCTCL